MQSLLEKAIPVFNCKSSQVELPDSRQSWHCLANPNQPERLMFRLTRFIQAFNEQQSHRVVSTLLEVEL